MEQRTGKTGPVPTLRPMAPRDVPGAWSMQLSAYADPNLHEAVRAPPPHHLINPISVLLATSPWPPLRMNVGGLLRTQAGGLSTGLLGGGA
jgi:hypothetical protein